MQSSIPFVPLQAIVAQMDTWGMEGTPFCFIINFDGSKAWAGSEDQAAQFGLHIAIKSERTHSERTHQLKKSPIDFDRYQAKFKRIQAGLQRGDSFLANLTAETPIETDADFRRIFEQADAAYKVLLEDQFVVFSPECFIQLVDHAIHSFPMKGTLSVAEHPSPDALLSDTKEQAEHATIVDLIRNDISQVAFPIQVEKYKYIDQIKTDAGDLWQMSSHISGKIIPAYQGKIGSILNTLLPAGSISGAPKAATLALIKSAEAYDRGFYTGIMGIFDGKNLDSGVMIRFIENQAGKLVFKSGGGITVFSDAKKEYEELIQKVYLPF